MIPKFNVVVEANKVIFPKTEEAKYRLWLSTQPDGDYQFYLKKASKHYPDRSKQQNRYYWGVVLHLLSEHTGHDPEELHEHFLIELAPTVDGLKQSLRTSDMDTAQMTDYIDKIRNFAAREGVVIPEPNEIEY